MIEPFLSELSELLGGSVRSRRRILDEVRDHLLLAAERGGEAAALAAFGEAWTVAAGFARERATAVLAPATLLALLAAALLAADPSSLGVLTVQLAVTCAGLSALRTWRHRRDPGAPAGALRHINRGNAVALAAVAAGAAPVAMRPLGIAALVVATLGAVALVASARRTSALAALDDAPAGGPVADDVLALLGGIPGVERAATWARAHPRGLCALVAGAAGAAAALGHGVMEGPPDHLGPAVLAGLILLAVEGAAVVSSYAVLGRWLGLR